ncbi:MAG: ORF6N domain-containing protein [Bacteroidia bacterium]
MAKKNTTLVIPDEVVMNKIYIIRGQKIMLDSDLAELYGVATKVLNQAVKRNIARFPDDFMFELTRDEYNSIRSQFVTLESGKGRYSKYNPYVFTEQGVAMLSGVLSSDRAIAVNIQIMRIFTRIRQMLVDNTELRLAIEELKKKTDNNTKNIELVFQYLDELLDKKENVVPRRQIGYKIKGKKLE